MRSCSRYDLLFQYILLVKQIDNLSVIVGFYCSVIWVVSSLPTGQDTFCHGIVNFPGIVLFIALFWGLQPCECWAVWEGTQDQGVCEADNSGGM